MTELEQLPQQGQRVGYIVDIAVYEQANAKLQTQIAQNLKHIAFLDSFLHKYQAPELSDESLKNSNCNERIDFENDLVYLAAAPDIQARFRQRDISKEEYNELWTNVFPEQQPPEQTALVPAAARSVKLERGIELYTIRLGYSRETVKGLATIAQEHHTTLAHLVNHFMLEDIPMEDISKVIELKNEYCFTINADSDKEQ